MAMARGIIAVAVLLWVALHLTTAAHAATYTVGDSSGWTFNVESWTDGKSFRAGDVLEVVGKDWARIVVKKDERADSKCVSWMVVFNYDPKEHNVVAVDQYSYDTCTVGEGATVYESGNDSVGLVKGENCFICSVLDHCDSGIRIHMIAL